MSDKKNIDKRIRFSFRIVEMIDELIERKGYMTSSEVVRQAVIEFHKKQLPDYIIQKDPSPQSKMRRREAEKEERRKIELDKRVETCIQLGGTVSLEHGTDYCTYHTYSYKVRYEQKIPVQQITEDLPKSQYFPSKEKVLQLQKDKKVNY